MDSMLTGVLVVAGVAALALALRAGSRRDETIQSPPPGETPEPEEAPATAPDREMDSEGEAAEDEFAVLSSDGWTFVPFGEGVRLWAPADAEGGPGEAPASGEVPTPGEVLAPSGVPKYRAARTARPATMLSAGDLIAARVVPGTPGEAPWCVEALGRDREFSAWSFETEEAAHAARELLERLVVKVPLGPDGEPAPVSDAEIEEARDIAEETLRELASMPEPEPPGEVK